MIKITVITPTYNRADKLPVLLNSLKQQTSKNFAWLLIDDGSTDHTEELVATWNIKEFPFCYMRQENGGKHRALNRVIPFVDTAFVYIVDSDDYLLRDAISHIEGWIKEIEKRPDIAAVSGLKISKTGKQISGFPPQIPKNSFVIADNFERWKIGLTGDQAEVYRTELLKKYPFPEFAGEKFISEATVWDRIASEGYKIKWINTPICVCEYLPGGLSSNMEDLVLKNFKGFTYHMKFSISHNRGWRRMKDIVRYIKISRIKGLSRKEISKILNISYAYVLVGNFIALVYTLYYNRGKGDINK